MNKERRKIISDQISPIEQIISDLEAAKDEEQEYYDNMPESFQSGEKGEAAQRAIDALGTACSNLEEAKSEIENIE